MNNETTFGELQHGEEFTLGSATIFKKTSARAGQVCGGNPPLIGAIYTFGLSKPVTKVPEGTNAVKPI